MKSQTRKPEQKGVFLNLAGYLLCAVLVTIVVLLILAVLLYRMNISAQIISASIIFTYVISCFVGGFLIGKKRKQKKYLWGLLIGGVYFLLVFFVSVLIKGSFKEVSDSLFTTLILCAGGGMLGGMLS